MTDNEIAAIQSVEEIIKEIRADVTKRHYLNAADKANTMVGVLLSALSNVLKEVKDRI